MSRWTPTADELAGIVDLFGELRRDELRRAVEELAFKRGEDVDVAAVSAVVDRALDEYALVVVPDDGAPEDRSSRRLAVGPTAFPTLPPRAEDLPHLLEVESRDPDRERLAGAAVERLREETVQAVAQGDTERIETLLDVCYDLEVWADVDVDRMRGALAEALSERED